MGLEDRLAAVEAQLEITRLINDYAHGFDKHDAPRFISLWHDDAVFAMPPVLSAQGPEEITKAAEAMWEGLRESHHWMANHSLDVTGDHATALVDADVVMQTPDGAWSRVAATYRDTFEKRDGRWAFTSRAVEILHQEPFPTR